MDKRDGALVLVTDPASDRLNADAVVDINQGHLNGEAWDSIAARNGTTRKNVQRIVQGRRHRNLHPLVRPDLYEEDAPSPATEPTITDLLAEANEASERLRRTLAALAKAIEQH